MFTKPVSAFILFALIIFIGCTKESQLTPLSSSDNSHLSGIIKGKDSLGEWLGTYTPYLGDPDGIYPDTITEQRLINNGKASVPYDSLVYPSDANRVASILYKMPSNQIINGDSIAFEASVNDDVNVIQMDLMGSKNIASISYNIDANNTGTCKLLVGNNVQSVSIPAVDFTTFKTVMLALNGKKAFFYIQNKLILSFNYSKANAIGTVQMLSIGNNYKQTKLSSPDNRSIDCDYVKLYNSISRKLVMKEDFNIVGKSNTIFY